MGHVEDSGVVVETNHMTEHKGPPEFSAQDADEVCVTVICLMIGLLCRHRQFASARFRVKRLTFVVVCVDLRSNRGSKKMFFFYIGLESDDLLVPDVDVVNEVFHITFNRR
jgi:hypothetical protein